MKTELKVGMVLLAGIVGVFFIYAAGLSAGLQFDDRANLNGLGAIVDVETLLQFAFSGNAGPLGRPLSLLSFGLQSASWPANPEDFIYVNILIHVLNGCLVAWMALLLSEQIFGRRQIYPALLVAGIWVGMPLLASSSLMIVQRMATLSGMMTLVGLLLFIKVRLFPAIADRTRVLGCVAVLVVFTGLAALAKENGVLFPVQCLAVEWLISQNAAHSMRERARLVWQGLFLAAPTLLIVIYLLARLPYSEATVASRGFDGTDRLLFEAKLLFEYLLNGFIPRVDRLGPFHDQMLVVHDTYFYLTAGLAIVSWGALGALFIRLRKRYPELLFGYFWYLGGHLVESSTVALELYFEHRNYIPMVGVVVALVFFSFRFRAVVGEKLYGLLSCGYLILIGLVLYGQTSLWGNSFMAAIMWSHYNPESPRSMLNLVSVYQASGSATAGLKVVDDFYEQHGDLRAKFMRLIILCEQRLPISMQDTEFDFAASVKYKSGYALWLSSAFERLYVTEQERHCEGLDEEAVYRLGGEILKAREVTQSVIAKHNINAILAAMMINSGKFDEAKSRLLNALNASFNLDTFDVALRVAKHTKDSELEAYLWRKVYESRPRGVVKQQVWDRHMRALETAHPRAGHV